MLYCGSESGNHPYPVCIRHVRESTCKAPDAGLYAYEYAQTES